MACSDKHFAFVMSLWKKCFGNSHFQIQGGRPIAILYVRPRKMLKNWSSCKSSPNKSRVTFAKDVSPG